MAKHRRMLMLCMALLFFAGAALTLYPGWRGRLLDKAVQDSAAEFLDQYAPASTPAAQPETEPEQGNPAIRENQALWDAAVDYNTRLWAERQAGLKDPWSYQEASLALEDFGIDNGVFAVIVIPRLELEMPIYLGASNQNLSLGAAHLSQTDLPIGGEDSNCVLAGHRGWNNGTFFHDIVILEPGDEVKIINLWQELTYQVTSVRVIESNDLEKIKIQPGKDMLTLLTCYYGNNGQKMRFAVFCERTGESDPQPGAS